MRRLRAAAPAAAAPAAAPAKAAKEAKKAAKPRRTRSKTLRIRALRWMQEAPPRRGFFFMGVASR